MPSAATKRRLAEDAGAWLLDGLVSADTAKVLRDRYSAEDFGFVGVIRYLGISGGILALLGLLGAGVALTGSEGFGGFTTTAVGAAVLAAGLWLSNDLRSRYGTSSKVVLALGVVAVALGIGLVAHASGVPESDLPIPIGAVAVPLSFLLAYRYRNPFLLVLAVLGLFGWIGSWSSMSGHSSYGSSDDLPKVLAAAALGVLAFGLWHERALERHASRFYVVYQSLALLYLNGALLVLSLDDGFMTWGHGSVPVYALLLTAAALGQIVLGARLHNSLFLAFGVIAAALDVLTRYYETFWDKLDRGLFFLAGGALLFGFGFAFEQVARSRRATVPA
jgi:hypothetical protein